MQFFPGKNDRPLDIRLNGVKLEQCGAKYQEKAVKFLGIWVDDKLNWSEHIDRLYKKLRSKIFLLSTVKKHFPQRLKIILYNSLYMPHINYGIIIWGNGKNWRKIEKSQKWALRTSLYKVEIQCTHLGTLCTTQSVKV